MAEFRARLRMIALMSLWFIVWSALFGERWLLPGLGVGVFVVLVAEMSFFDRPPREPGAHRWSTFEVPASEDGSDPAAYAAMCETDNWLDVGFATDAEAMSAALRHASEQPGPQVLANARMALMIFGGFAAVVAVVIGADLAVSEVVMRALPDASYLSYREWTFVGYGLGTIPAGLGYLAHRVDRKPGWIGYAVFLLLVMMLIGPPWESDYEYSDTTLALSQVANGLVRGMRLSMAVQVAVFFGGVVLVGLVAKVTGWKPPWVRRAQADPLAGIGDLGPPGVLGRRRR